MKKALSAGLAILMLIMLIPTVATAANSFKLTINGGQTKTYTVKIDNEDCLKVDVYLEGIDNQHLLASTAFALQYNSKQLTYVTNSQAQNVSSLYEIVNASGKTGGKCSLVINPADAGVIRFAMATSYACKIKDGMPLISLYFKVKPLVANTKINFTLGENPTIETMNITQLSGSATTTKGSLVANFSPFIASKGTTVTGASIVWNTNDIQYNGTTPYVVYTGKARKPRFTVKDKNGKTIDSQYYSYQYKENTKPGTGYLYVTFLGPLYGTCDSSFKIYLPATTSTSVTNTKSGIKIKWDAVDGAAGYVIYRRAWNSISNGWTKFDRWDNTTALYYIDGADSDHKVYAGTRYQYGVKAYFARRTDPITGKEIGGNVNNSSGNYNLGLVGPLKTTVRITTRTLNSVTGGNKRIMVKWTGSKVFTGYQVQIATDSTFKTDLQTVKITDAKTYETTITGLKAKTTYYVRVRSYHVVDGYNYYGGWSSVKNASTN